jgi:membrane fusion protein (multidrug efflux system)
MLWERNLIAKQELDNAETSMKVAKANNDLAQTHLDYARITAPFNGIVTKRFLDPGVALKANDAALFTVMDLEEMKIMVNVLEKDIPRVSRGTRAVITVDAFPGKEFTGSITRLSEAVDLATRTMAIEIDIPNPGRLLKAGMFATIVLIVGEHPDAVTIPSSALVKDDRGTFVFVVQEATARRKELKLGIEQDGRTEVLSGLGGDEKIVSAGQQLLKDGSAVTVQQ